MNLEYNVILKKKEKTYLLFIPELSIITEENTLEKTFETLETEKRNYFEKIIKMEAQDTIKLPVSIVSKKRIVEDITVFSVKTIIFTCLLFLLILGSRLFISKIAIDGISDFRRNMSSFAITMPSTIINEYSNRLNSMSNEQKAAIIESFRKNIILLKPVFEELREIYDNEQCLKLNDKK